MVRPRRHDGPGGFRNGPPGGNGGYGGLGYDARYEHPYSTRGGGYRDGSRPFDSYDSYRPGPPPLRFDERYHARPPPPRNFRGPPGPRFYSDGPRGPPPPRDNWGPREGPRSDGIPPWELRQRRQEDSGNANGGARRPPALFANRAPAPAPLAPASGRRGASPPRAPRSPRVPVILPPDDYVGFSAEQDVYSDHVEPKLLVLDLNGALVYRSASGPAKQRRAYPRPFLHNFLEYLFGPDADGRAWEVFVWSSAQPHNVRKMVETTFGPVYSRGIWDQPEPEKDELHDEGKEQSGEVHMDGQQTPSSEQGHLLGVWARDKMSLGDNYFKKVQTQKDLRKVIEHLGKFDEKRIVLLDDSPLKGVYQPWSQIVITEYDKPEFKDSKDAIMRLAERTAKSLKVSESEPEVEAAKEEKEAASAEESAEASAAVDPTHEPGLDTTLLAVIGILEAMRNVKNVPAFVRGGGILTPSAELTIDSSEVSASTLPSHATFAHWFSNAETLNYWTQKGHEALQRRDIPLEHGMRFSASGEFYPLGEDTPLKEEQEKEGSKDSGKGKLLKGKKAEAAYRHLQAVAEGDMVSEHQRSAVWAALQVLKDIGLAPQNAPEDVPPRSPSLSPKRQSATALDAVDAVSSPSGSAESKKRPRYQSPSRPATELAEPAEAMQE